MKQLRFWGLMTLGCLLGGCDAKSFRDPPLTITFRSGVLSKSVMQVSNLSTDEGVEVYVYVASADTSTRSGNTVIPANGEKEFGVLELKWEFKAGDKGFVRPVKYGKKLFFEMMQDNQYKTWFGYEDIPEVDVAAQVRARKRAEHAAWLQKTMTDMKVDGVGLYIAITNANAERAAIGHASVWPKAQGALMDRAKDKLKNWKTKVRAKFAKQGAPLIGTDVAEKKFGTSGEYFDCLFDVGRAGSDQHSPYVKHVPVSLASTSEAKGGSIPAESVRWHVLADYDENMADCIPVLVSANFPCDKLRSFWDGKMDANEIVALASVGELRNEAFVVVYGNGMARAFTSEKATLSNIYRGAFNTFTNGYNCSIRYLTPKDLVGTVGVEM